MKLLTAVLLRKQENACAKMQLEAELIYLLHQ